MILVVGNVHAGSLLQWPEEGGLQTGNVIFIHPDGTSVAHWGATRNLYAGPDGMLHWDRLARLAVYRSHMRDTFGTTSHGGGTTHAYGVKVPADSFGMSHHDPLTSLSGKSYSVMTEAMHAGMNVGIINSGSLIEPGTGAFLAHVPQRDANEAITIQIMASGVPIILAGGEEWLLPTNAAGRHVSAGRRTDGLDLIALARRRGYTVVYDRDELAKVPTDTRRLLGIFAAAHTFHDDPEETLRASGLPTYEPLAPTLAEMTAAALRIFGGQTNRFFLMIEEEGTDNFSNHGNARGMLEALHRADEAVGVARAFRAEHPDTLVMTAADSDASGPQMIASPDATNALPASTSFGAPMDGADGLGTVPFLAAPDQFGRRHAFGIAWIGKEDTNGGIVARAEGPNADLLLSGCLDNTDIYRLIYATLFGRRL